MPLSLHKSQHMPHPYSHHHIPHTSLQITAYTSGTWWNKATQRGEAMGRTAGIAGNSGRKYGNLDVCFGYV